MGVKNLRSLDKDKKKSSSSPKNELLVFNVLKSAWRNSKSHRELEDPNPICWATEFCDWEFLTGGLGPLWWVEECTTQLQQIWSSGVDAISEDVVAMSAITSLSQHQGLRWRCPPRGSCRLHHKLESELVSWTQDLTWRRQCTATKMTKPNVKAALTQIVTRINWSSGGLLATSNIELQRR